MDVIAKVKEELGNDNPDTLLFGYAVGVRRKVLFEGDTDRKLLSVLALVQEAIGLLREEMGKQKLFREITKKDVKYLQEAAKIADVRKRKLHRAGRWAVRRRE